MKFEYATTVFEVSKIGIGSNLDYGAFQKKLDEYGAGGWELTNVFPICRVEGVTHEIVAVFKRQLT